MNKTERNARIEARIAELNEENEAREYLMSIVRSEVVRPELKKRALKAVMELDFDLAMAKMLGVRYEYKSLIV